MILTCPACGTQYVVKDGAIPEGGRKVRCASCRHSWHQDPPPLELEEPLAADDVLPAEDVAATDDAELQGGTGEVPQGDAEPSEYAAADPDEPSLVDGGPTHQPVGAQRAEPDSDYIAAPGGEIADLQPPEEEVDDDFSPFAARGPAERRRRSPLVAILLVIVLVAAAAALFWFLAPPEWKARVGLAEAGQTPLQLMLTHRDRQSLESGNELLAVSGRVINPTTKTQQVPPIQAELRSKSGQLVYRWTIAPPTATLAPGASTPFNSAEVNVPSGGEELTVSLGAPGA